MSALLTAIMAAAVLSMALTARRGSGRSDRKTLCAQATREVSARLKSFVTAYYIYGTGWDGTEDDAGAIPGPGGGTNQASWTWAAVGVTDALGGYALSETSGCDLTTGTNCHKLTTGVLPANFIAAPFNAFVAYSVNAGAINYGSGRLRAPEVSVTCHWDEPQ